MVLVFTDIIRSVDLKTKHGDSAAAKLIARHDQIFKSLIKQFVSAENIKDTGDGFLAAFPTASDAVRFALRFQHAIATEDWGEITLRVRIGIHLGEVSELDIEEQTGRSKLSGLAVDLTARLMGLAAPNQVLLTRAAFDGARQFVRIHPLAEDGEYKELSLTWVAHGSYVFQGSDDAMEVFEVGPAGIAPLTAPLDSEKAHRSVTEEDEKTLGWRPAAGAPVPMRTHWTLDHKLDGGAFGEAWLALHERTGERRVFKFCFDAEKLRSLKRELALFQLLRKALGDRADIAKLYDVQLDEPPFFLECEFTNDGTLVEWAKNQGGIAKVPLTDRLELFARIAEAVAAAHSVGVLHKDIEPKSILIYRTEESSFRPKLTDFGIGELTDLSRVTGDSAMKDFSAAMLEEEQTEGDSGAQMYAPPELLAGRPFTIQGDLYSLGVMLYQFVVGDLKRPIAEGWERDIEDPLLCEDIRRCVEGHEQDRLASAKELAERLRTLPQRRKARRRKRITRVAGYSSGILIVLLGISIVLMAHERNLRMRAERAEATTEEVNDFMNNTMAEANFWEGSPEGATIIDVVRKAAKRLDEGDEFRDRPEIEGELRATIGRIFRARSRLAEAKPHLDRALEIRKSLHEDDHADVAESIFELAAWHWASEEFTRAEPMYLEALAMRQRLFGQEHPLIADCLNHIAACVDKLDRHDEAEKLYKQALDMRRRLFGEDHEDIAASLNNYATCLRSQGRNAEAEPLFRESLEIITRIRGESHPLVALAKHTLATALIELDKLDEAAKLLEESVELKRKTFPLRHVSLASSLTKLAYVLVSQGEAQLDKARTLCEESLSIRRSQYRQGHPMILETIELLALIHLKQGDNAAAEPLVQEVISLCNAGSPRPYDEHATLLGQHLTSMKRFADAEPILLDAHRSAEKAKSPHLAHVNEQLIKLYTDWQKPDQTANYQAKLDQLTK